MSDRDHEIETVLGELAEEGGRARALHPTPEQLAAYQEGQLTAEEAADLQEHLLWCRVCTGLLLDMGRFPDLGSAPAEGPPPAAAEQDWDRVRQRLAEDEGQGLLRFRRPRPPHRRARTRLAWAMAASFLLATVGLSIWGRGLSLTVSDLSRPQVNVPIQDLYPEDSERADAGAGTVPLLPAGEASTLVIHLLDGPGRDEYRAEIVDHEGVVAWSGEGLRRSPLGPLTLALPAAFARPGRYEIRVHGTGAERALLIETYPFEISGEP